MPPIKTRILLGPLALSLLAALSSGQRTWPTTWCSTSRKSTDQLLVLGAHGLADVLDARVAGCHQVVLDDPPDGAQDQHGQEHMQADLKIKHDRSSLEEVPRQDMKSPLSRCLIHASTGDSWRHPIAYLRLRTTIIPHR